MEAQVSLTVAFSSSAFFGLVSHFPLTRCPVSESVDPSSEESAKEGPSRGASALGTRSEWASVAPRAGSAPRPS